MIAGLREMNVIVANQARRFEELHSDFGIVVDDKGVLMTVGKPDNLIGDFTVLEIDTPFPFIAETFDLVGEGGYEHDLYPGKGSLDSGIEVFHLLAEFGTREGVGVGSVGSEMHQEYIRPEGENRVEIFGIGIEMMETDAVFSPPGEFHVGMARPENLLDHLRINLGEDMRISGHEHFLSGKIQGASQGEQNSNYKPKRKYSHKGNFVKTKKVTKKSPKNKGD